jgi:hypothetical protein
MKTLLIRSLALLGVAIASVMVANVPIESIDYARVKSHLPKGWSIEKVQVVDAPHGWTRTKGGSGIQVSLKNQDATVHDAMVGDYHPTYSFTLLPLEWEGTNQFATVFSQGKIDEGKSDRALQVYPDQRKVVQTHQEGTPAANFFRNRYGAEIAQTLTDEQLKTANSWKITYLRRLRQEKTDESYVSAYLKAWILSPNGVFAESK